MPSGLLASVAEALRKKIENRRVNGIHEFEASVEPFRPAYFGVERFESFEFDPYVIAYARPFDEVRLAAGPRHVGQAHAVIGVAVPPLHDLGVDRQAFGGPGPNFARLFGSGAEREAELRPFAPSHLRIDRTEARHRKLDRLS